MNSLFASRDRATRTPFLWPWLLAPLGVMWGLLLIRLPFLEGLMVTVVAAVAIAGLVEPLVGVGASLFLAPLWAWLNAELPRVPPLIGQMILGLAIFLWLVRGLMRRDLCLPFPPLLLPLLLFLGVALLSLWSPADVWIGYWEWVKWGQILAIFLVVYDRLHSDVDHRRITWILICLVGVALFQAALGLWQFGLREDGPEHFAILDGFYRAYGTFEQPNPYAGFLGLLGAFLTGLTAGTVGEALRQRHYPPWWFWASAVATAVVLTALLASWSRGGWMGFGAALLVIAAGLPSRRRWGLLLVIVFVVGGWGVLQAGLLGPSITARLLGFLEYTRFEDVRGVGINDANYAVVERMAHWQAALEMWRSNFWLGVGLGCYEPAYPEYSLINWPFALGHAHNYYLNLLAEVGLVGFVCYLLWLGSLFWRSWQALYRLSGWRRSLLLGVIGSWTHLAVHSLVDNLLVNNVHLHVGVLLALNAWAVHLVTSDYLSAPSEYRPLSPAQRY